MRATILGNKLQATVEIIRDTSPDVSIVSTLLMTDGTLVVVGDCDNPLSAIGVVSRCELAVVLADPAKGSEG